MSLLQPRRLAFSLTLSLLWPTVAFADSTSALRSKSPRVQIKADFVVARTSDVDNLGINFGLLPLTAPTTDLPANQKPAFLLYAVGSVAAQTYQTLTRTGGHIIHIPPVTAAEDSAAVIRVDAFVPDGPPQAKTADGFGHFPKLTQVFEVQGEMTLIPQSHPDGTVTLNLVLPGGFGKPIPLKAVHSGEMLVFNNVIIRKDAPVGQDGPILRSLFATHIKQDDAQELLIFVTPTIVGTDARKTAAVIP